MTEQQRYNLVNDEIFFLTKKLKKLKELKRIRRLEERQSGKEYRKIGNIATEIFAGGTVVFGTVMGNSIATGESTLANPSFLVAAGGVAICLGSAIAFRIWGLSQSKNQSTTRNHKS